MLARTEAKKRLERRRARWREWYRRDKVGVATARVRYSGRGLAELIVSGWLPAREFYTNEEIGDAIARLLEYGSLPRKPNGLG